MLKSNIELLKRNIIGDGIDRNNNRVKYRQMEYGEFWPLNGYSLIGKRRLDNIQECIETIISDNIAGDLMEAGVWRGGAAILMRGLLKEYEIQDRLVLVADSFKGLPNPVIRVDYDCTFYDDPFLSVSKEEVQDNFSKFGLLDSQVRFVEGYFEKSLPGVSNTLALLRIDCDLYKSTMDVLENMYMQVSRGGFVIVDDYDLSYCKQAVSDFRRAHKVSPPIESIDGHGVFWRVD